MTPRTSPLVAIFNSRDEVIEAIRSALENDGFETVTARLAEIQNGTLDLVAFIKVHAPDVIVYDLPRPYEAHLELPQIDEGNDLSEGQDVGPDHD